MKHFPLLLLSLGMMCLMSTSCLENKEPYGLEDLRNAKSEWYQAQSQLKAAETAVRNADTEYQNALTEGKRAMNELQQIDNQIQAQLLEQKKLAVEHAALEYTRDSIDTEIKRLEIESANAQLEADKEFFATQIAEYQKLKKQYEADIKGYEADIAMKERDILDLRYQMEVLTEEHLAKMYELQEKTAIAERNYHDALAAIAASDSLLSESEKQQLEGAIARVDEARGKVSGKKAEIDKLTNDILDLRISLQYDSEILLLQAANKVKTDSLGLELAKENRNLMTGLLDGISTDNYLARIADMKAERDRLTQLGNNLAIQAQELEKQSRLAQDTIDRLDNEITAIYDLYTTQNNNIINTGNAFYTGTATRSIPLPTDPTLKQMVTDQIFYAIYAELYTFKDYQGNDVDYYMKEPDGLVFADGRYVMPDTWEFTETFDWNRVFIPFMRDIYISTFLLSGNDLAVLNSEIAVMEADFLRLKEDYDTTLARFIKYRDLSQAQITEYRMGQNYDLQAEVIDAYNGLLAKTDPTDADIQAVLDAVKTYIDLRFAIENNGTKPDAAQLTVANYRTGTIDLSDYINYAGYYPLSESTCQPGGTLYETGDAAYKLWGQRDRTVEFGAADFPNGLPFVWDSKNGSNPKGNTYILSNDYTGNILSSEGFSVSRTSLTTNLFLYRYATGITVNYSLWYDYVTTEYHIEFLKGLTASTAAVKEWKAVLDSFIAGIQAEEEAFEATVSEMENERDRSYEKIAVLTAEKRKVTARKLAIDTEKAFLNEQKGIYNDGITSLNGWINDVTALFEDTDLGALLSRYGLSAETLTEEPEATVKAIIEMIKAILENNVILQEKALAESERAYQDELNGLTDRAEEISDKENELEMLKVELEALITAYENYVEQLNSLMSLLYEE